MIFDSSLIIKQDTRDDVITVGIPATKMASDNGLDGLANMIILGKTLKETGLLTLEQIESSLSQMVPAKKAELLKNNIRAIELGYNYR